jgi:integrase
MYCRSSIFAYFTVRSSSSLVGNGQEIDGVHAGVQAIAGHSGIQVTMSIYAHAAQEEEERKALRELGERLA